LLAISEEDDGAATIAMMPKIATTASMSITVNPALPRRARQDQAGYWREVIAVSLGV